MPILNEQLDLYHAFGTVCQINILQNLKPIPALQKVLVLKTFLFFPLSATFWSSYS